MLIHYAYMAETTVQQAEMFGIKAQLKDVDWGFMVRRVTDGIDGEVRMIEEGNWRTPNIAICKNSGRFIGEKSTEVSGEQFTAESVIIAARTRPFVPAVQGMADVPYLTSNEALRLPKQPRRITIAMEMAYFFGALGTEVAIVHWCPPLLWREDEQVAKEAGAPYIVSSYNYADTAYGAAIEDRGDFVKLLIHRRHGRSWDATSSAATPQCSSKRLPMPCDYASLRRHHPADPRASALPEVVQRAFGGLP